MCSRVVFIIVVIESLNCVLTSIVFIKLADYFFVVEPNLVLALASCLRNNGLFVQGLFSTLKLYDSDSNLSPCSFAFPLCDSEGETWSNLFNFF